MGRRLRLRGLLDDALDWLRYRVDHSTVPHYQPLPWPTRRRHTRAEGVTSRWEAMLPVIREVAPASAADIGCNVGWYSQRLASLGIPTVGIEGYAPYYRTALYSAKRAPSRKLAITVMTIDEENVRLLPRDDCTLFLSIWHHLVRDQGLDEATAVLSGVWRRTGKVLFFESGEQEMGPEYRLPNLTPDPRQWFTRYLGDVCVGAEVRHLGLHHGGEGGPDVAWRNLFAVARRVGAQRQHPAVLPDATAA